MIDENMLELKKSNSGFQSFSNGLTDCKNCNCKNS